MLLLDFLLPSCPPPPEKLNVFTRYLFSNQLSNKHHQDCFCNFFFLGGGGGGGLMIFASVPSTQITCIRKNWLDKLQIVDTSKRSCLLSENALKS